MLILTRRVGESLLIGHDISVTVVAISGNQIRLGVDAPKTTAIYRDEVFQRLKHEGVCSASKAPEAGGPSK